MSDRQDVSKSNAKQEVKPADQHFESNQQLPLTNWQHLFKNAAPSRFSPRQILQLQRTIGNLAVSHMLEGRTIQRFPKQAEVYKQEFIEKAAATIPAPKPEIAQKLAESLYTFTLGGQMDPVTGFEDATDYNPTMARAIEHVKGKKGSAFSVNVSIRNLGGLNAVLKTSGANQILGEFSRIVGEEIDKVGGEVSKFRRGGTNLQFVVVGDAVRQSHIEAQLMVAQKRIQEHAIKKSLDKIDHPKYKYEKGTGIIYEIQPVKAAHHADEPDAGRQKENSHGRGENFKSATQERKDTFIEMAVGQYGLSESQAEELFALSGADAVDTLTGFDKAVDRMATLKNAIEYVRNNDASGVYVDVDLRNLGGLTKAVGRAKADEVYTRMASVTENAVMSLEADVSRFRHGGDEFSFIVVGPNVNLAAVKVALETAQKQIQNYVIEEELHTIEHPKYPGNANKRGTGITFGLAAITGAADETVESILNTADVENKKN